MRAFPQSHFKVRVLVQSHFKVPPNANRPGVTRLFVELVMRLLPLALQCEGSAVG